MATDVVYLSPHLDDAALSCGGLIHRQARAGTHVLVVTVFAGPPEDGALSALAAQLHARWGDLADVVAARRQEDEKAMRFLGAEPLYLQYPDAIYRLHRGSFLYPSEESLFESPRAPDLDLASQIAESLHAIHLPRRPTIYAPLAVGNHVDHQLVREAGLNLQRRSYPAILYEDYPYVEVPGALTEALDRVGPERCSEEIQEIREQDIAAKIAAIAAYASQMDSLFKGADSMSQRVRDYARALSSGDGYGERFWRISSSVSPVLV